MPDINVNIILTVVIAIVIWLIVCRCRTRERFNPSFAEKYYEPVWDGARLVRIKEINSGMYITYIRNTGMLRLSRSDPDNMYQYFLHSKVNGALMSASEKVCVTQVYPGNPIGVTICDGTGSQTFRMMSDGKILCMTEVPYYALDNKEYINSLRPQCLQGADSGKYRVPITLDCSVTDSRWEIEDADMATYVNSVAGSWKSPLAKPATSLKPAQANLYGYDRPVYDQKFTYNRDVSIPQNDHKVGLGTYSDFLNADKVNNYFGREIY